MSTNDIDTLIKPIKHGTIYGYAGQNCRCEECKEAARRYSQAYRQSDKGRVASRKSASRNNFIRQEALNWVRRERPDLVGVFEAKWEEITVDKAAVI